MHKTPEHEDEFVGSKRIKFRGIAQVPLDSISFSDTSITQVPTIDRNDVHQLKNTFLSRESFRYDEKNYISALVHANQLDEALDNAKLDRQALVRKPDKMTYPILRFPVGYTLCGLQGQHRILAGREVLLENNMWWTVRLYVQEEHSNPEDVLDGEKFRMIHICQIYERFNEEKRWWAGLTYTMQKDFKQLIKYTGFMREIDGLIQIPGLWSSVKMGVLRRLFVLKCDEELIHYLRHINTIWHQIASHLGKDIWAIDDATVEYLQLRAPGISSTDRRAVSVAMESGQLFPLLVDSHKRVRLLASILDIQALIPTIQTFFDNLLYLEPCSKVMKGLLSPKSRLTVRQSFEAAFSNPLDHFVEETEDVFRIGHSGSDDILMSSYKQLWLYSMRHFPEMVSMAPKKENGQPNPRVKEPNSWFWYNFAAMAKRLGFETTKSKEILSTNPDVTIARKVLLEARPQDCYYFDEEQLNLYTRQISEMLATAKRRTSFDNYSKENISKNREARSHRSGRPYEDSQVMDKRFLFLPIISNKWPLGEYEEVTSYFVKRDFFTSFFDIGYDDQQYLANSYDTMSDDASPAICRNKVSVADFSVNWNGEIPEYKGKGDNVTGVAQVSRQQPGCKMNLAKAYDFGLLRKNQKKLSMRVLEKRKKMIERVIKQSATQRLQRKKRHRRLNHK
ncbi:MAG: hypothetical protein M1839_001475 [Geoglossum umbratile]|nr:MAG: hypothetical protein M1839_001475 [Geoglossum umbratile]